VKSNSETVFDCIGLRCSISFLLSALRRRVHSSSRGPHAH
jgi:hypothetical protein